MNKKILVTATPPTTNGDLHLGHLSGPYLAADVYTRAQRMLGSEVLYISSTDDNQSYLMTKALQENRSTIEVIEDYTNKITKSLKVAAIEMDAFTSPLNDAHIKRVQQFFMELYREGKLEVRVIPTCYCEQCQKFLFEAYIKGGCPTCGASAGGQFCEECGHPNDPLELIDAHCTMCGDKPIVKNFTGVWFPVEPYRRELEQFVEKHSTKWRPHLVSFFHEILGYEELPAFLISNPSNWGIPIPLEGFEDQVINVWFEMLPGHIQSTITAEGGNTDKAIEWWGKEDDTTLVQFFGFDNSIYYAVYHTAMLIAHGKYRLADTFIVNEFYLLENKKFSTSRKHAIWGSEFFNEANSDWLRYHLCLTGPELEQTNFSVAEFQQTLEGKTLTNWHKLCEVAMTAIEQGGGMPIDPSPQVQSLVERYHELFASHYSMENFSIRQAAETLAIYISEGLECVKLLTAADAYLLLHGLCLYSLPITPSFGRNLKSYLCRLESDAAWELKPPLILNVNLEFKNRVLESFPLELLKNVR